MGFYGYGAFPRYESVAEKRAKAMKQLAKFKKSGKHIEPIVIEGNSIARSWWGKAWNANLTRYSDYSNRIGRGRSYLRHGAVLDLKITKGRVTALVQGSSSKPYEISVRITSLPSKTVSVIKGKCGKRLSSLQALLSGSFPKELEEIFLEKGKGLFPSPREIRLECSCPDYADMCKHVAAVLFGVGAKLDKDPSLFFTLRSIALEELISGTIESNRKKLLKKTGATGGRVMKKADLTDVFGIEIAGTDTQIKPRGRPRSGKSGRPRSKS